MADIVRVCINQFSLPRAVPRLLQCSSACLLHGTCTSALLPRPSRSIDRSVFSRTGASSQMEKREVLHKQAREMIYKVHQYFLKEARESECPTCANFNSVVKCQSRTAAACGVGLRTVQKILSEGRNSLKNTGSLSFTSPGKRRSRRKDVTDMDDYNKNILRITIFDMYARGEVPTAEKLIVRMKEAVGFSGSKWSMLKILRGMGFKYSRSHDGRKFLLERNDIVAARTIFLRTMHEIREEGTCRVYYLDETSINVGVGKGGHLVVCHAGSAAMGFIPQSLLVFHSEGKGAAHHTDMTGAAFRTWFEEQLLPYLEPNSVIVMDNARTHSTTVDRTPSSNTKKCDVVAWLSNRNIPHTGTQTRAELLQLVKMQKPAYGTYEIDAIAVRHNHRVVRLPVHHNHYNPIELIWAQVKGYVAERNTTFKAADVERLTLEAINGVTAAAWGDCVRHAEQLQEDDLVREIARDNVIDTIIVNICDTDSEDMESSEDEEEAN